MRTAVVKQQGVGKDMGKDVVSQAQLEQLRAQAREVSGSLLLNHAPETLWPYLSNTDMINALSALPPIKILPGADTGALSVESQDLGLRIRYHELPYEWVRPEWLAVERVFTQGAIGYLRFRAVLEQAGPNQTLARLSLAAVPKLPWLLLKPRLQQILGRLLRSYQAVDKRLGTQQPSLAAEAFGSDPARHAARIEILQRDWLPLSSNPELVRCVAEHICCAPERYVGRIRPFELARRYGFDRLETLRFFLRATREGFLNLSWDLLCPRCQGAKGQSASLSDLEPAVHCEACGIDFTGRFDENFELTFNPVPTLRAVQDAAYCAGSPANTAHVCLQRNLWPGQTLDWELQLPAGQYRLRSSGTGSLPFSIADEGESQFSLTLGRELSPPETPLILSPGCRLRVGNPGERFISLRIDDLAWREDRVSAGLVSTLQDFRDMFSSEVLRPGVNLAVSNLTVMFTDLKDSTLMYDVKGDAHAFSLVQDHFELMMKLIRAAGGAIVKTIGDAVMAVFQDPAQGLACGLEIQREFRNWNARYRDQPDRRVVIKLGLHLGPCIALNLNDKLDYFGSTINKAARIQNESVGDDIVISDEMLQGLETLIAGCRRERFEKDLKGLSERAILHRIRLGDEA